MGTIATLHAALDAPPPLTRPLFLSLVVAGFPSPADDHLDRDLDLHELLIQHPAATFYVRLSGDSMRGAGLYDGDILVVDRSLEPKHHDIVIAVLDGELTVKRLYRQGTLVQLRPAKSPLSHHHRRCRPRRADLGDGKASRCPAPSAKR